MLYNNTKKKALAACDKAIEKNNAACEILETECLRLYQTHKQVIELIVSIEAFINSISNTPQKFTPNLAFIEIDRTKLRKTEDYVAEAQKKVLDYGSSVVTGVTVGIISRNTVPPATKWYVSTFGTASTGTPIASLSGAAKENAIYAWLGGGTKAMGGGGVVAGQARLEFAANIVSWFLSIIVKQIADEMIKNKNEADQANEETDRLTKDTEQRNKSCVDVWHRHVETEELMSRVREQFKSLETLKDRSYGELTNDEQSQLDSLINNTLALAEMLNQVVE